MDRYTWKSELTIGHLLVDSEHKHIIELLQAFLDKKDVENPSVEELFLIESGVQEHLYLHFAHEEALMELYGVPEEELQKHKDEHNKIREHLLGIKSQLAKEDIPSYFEFAKLSLITLYDHISTLDKELWEAIQKNWISSGRPKRKLLINTKLIYPDDKP